GRPLPDHGGACLTPRHTLHMTLDLAPPTASMLRSPPERQQWRQALHSGRYQILRDSDVAWHSAQVRARHTGNSAYVWRDYAMIRRLSAVVCTRRAGRRAMGQRLPYVAVLDRAVSQTLGRGGHSDAPEAPMVERARGRRARWAGGRDGSGSSRRTV